MFSEWIFVFPLLALVLCFGYGWNAIATAACLNRLFSLRMFHKKFPCLKPVSKIGRQHIMYVALALLKPPMQLQSLVLRRLLRRMHRSSEYVLLQYDGSSCCTLAANVSVIIAFSSREWIPPPTCYSSYFCLLFVNIFRRSRARNQMWVYWCKPRLTEISCYKCSWSCPWNHVRVSLTSRSKQLLPRLWVSLLMCLLSWIACEMRGLTSISVFTFVFSHRVLFPWRHRGLFVSPKNWLGGQY